MTAKIDHDTWGKGNTPKRDVLKLTPEERKKVIMRIQEARAKHKLRAENVTADLSS